MNAQTKLIKLNQQRAAVSVKAAERLKSRLLLVFGVLVLCTAAIEYSVVTEPAGVAIKKISLMLTVLSLPVYFILLFIRECLRARGQRKRIAKMITQLTENVSKEKGIAREPRPGMNVKASRAGETDILVQKIIQVINA